MKNWLAGLVVLISPVAFAQGPSTPVGYQPAASAWAYNGSLFAPVTTTGTAGQGQGYVPAIAIWGYNATTNLYYPCGVSNPCLGAGGGGGGGTGTVTSFSAGSLTPLFTSSVATATTTPALTFALSSQSANTFFAAPNGSAGTPVFRAIVAADVPALPYDPSGAASPVAPASITGIRYGNGTGPSDTVATQTQVNGYLTSPGPIGGSTPSTIQATAIGGTTQGTIQANSLETSTGGATASYTDYNVVSTASCASATAVAAQPHAGCTTGIPTGYVCTIDHAYATATPTYAYTGDCKDGLGGHFWYSQPFNAPQAIGTETAWGQRYKCDGNGNCISSSVIGGNGIQLNGSAISSAATYPSSGNGFEYDCTATSANVAATLPPAISLGIFVLKNLSASTNTCSLMGNGHNIDGQASITVPPGSSAMVHGYYTTGTTLSTTWQVISYTSSQNLFSAAGTPLTGGLACAAGLQGKLLTVSDATSPTYMGTYTSGGAIPTPVICSYNGTAYAWLTH